MSDSLSATSSLSLLSCGEDDERGVAARAGVVADRAGDRGHRAGHRRAQDRVVERVLGLLERELRAVDRGLRGLDGLCAATAGRLGGSGGGGGRGARGLGAGVADGVAGRGRDRGRLRGDRDRPRRPRSPSPSSSSAAASAPRSARLCASTRSACAFATRDPRAAVVEPREQLALGDVLARLRVDLRDPPAGGEVHVGLARRLEVAAAGHDGLDHAARDRDRALGDLPPCASAPTLSTAATTAPTATTRAARSAPPGGAGRSAGGAWSA